MSKELPPGWFAPEKTNLEEMFQEADRATQELATATYHSFPGPMVECWKKAIKHLERAIAIVDEIYEKEERKNVAQVFC